MELKHNFGIGFGAAMVFAAILISNAYATVNLTVGDYLINPGADITIYLNVSTTDALAGVGVNITYNNSLLGWKGYNSMSGFSFSTMVPPTVGNTDIEMQLDNIDGKGGDFSVVNVTFNASNTACGVRVPIGIKVKIVTDNATSGTVSINQINVQNGSVTIKCDSCSCGVNNICNTTTHLCQATTMTYYKDADNDTYGNATNTTQNTTCPMGYVSNSLDCNDNDNATHPGAIYDGIDNNCVNGTDEGFCISNESVRGNHTNSTICIATSFCNVSHLCEAKRANGTACLVNEQCQNGNSTQLTILADLQVGIVIILDQLMILIIVIQVIFKIKKQMKLVHKIMNVWGEIVM